MQGLPAVKYTDSYKKYQLTSYMVKYSLEKLPVLERLKSIAHHWIEQHPDNEIAQLKLLALERAIEKKQDDQTLNDVKEVLL